MNFQVQTENTKPKAPSDYAIPHESWRPNQLELIEKILASDKEFFILEAPTGTGKSVIATAMGFKSKVLVLAHTLALLHQYRDKYNFSIVMGKQEYPCVLQSKVDQWQFLYHAEPTAADCTIAPMYECIEVSRCPYLIAKTNALSARRSACTYRYAALSQTLRQRPGILVMDEAHDAAEELINFNKFEIGYDKIKNEDFDEFPILTYGENNKGAVVGEKTIVTVIDWLLACGKNIGEKIIDAEDESREKSRYLKMHSRIMKFYTSLIKGNKWFLMIDNEGVSFQSLDATQVASDLFRTKSKKLLMSATIGDPEPLTKILGIDKNDYEFHSSLHPVPTEYRTVSNLNFYRMTKRNLDAHPDYFELQVKAMWRWLLKFPEEYRGVILTSSYFKIAKIEEFIKPLAKKSQRRLIVQHQGNKVGDVVQKFITDIRPGDIMIGTVQGMGAGIDLHHDLARWLIIAGVPHTNPTDQYMKARREQEGGAKYQRWTVYTSVVQACGRVSRGERNEEGEWLHNYMAIADGSATTKMGMKYYPIWYVESIK